jgi:hypothetical protein
MTRYTYTYFINDNDIKCNVSCCNVIHYNPHRPRHWHRRGPAPCASPGRQGKGPRARSACAGGARYPRGATQPPFCASARVSGGAPRARHIAMIRRGRLERPPTPRPPLRLWALCDNTHAMASTIAPGVSQSVCFLVPTILSPVVHAYLSAVAPAPRSRSSPLRGRTNVAAGSTSVLLPARSCVCADGEM